MTIFRDKGLVNVFQCCSRQKQLFFNNCKIAFWENSAPVVWDKGTIKAIAPSMFNKNVFFSPTIILYWSTENHIFIFFRCAFCLFLNEKCKNAESFLRGLCLGVGLG